MSTDPGGDDADYVAFVQARWGTLFRTARMLTNSHAEAEDLLQTTLAKAYARWDKVRKADAPEAYVRTMVVNEAISAARTANRRRGKGHLLVAPEPVHDDPSDRLDLRERITALPVTHRAVIVLRYYHDLSEAQIAEALGISPGTVKSRASTALRSLRAGFSDVDDPEVTR